MPTYILPVPASPPGDFQFGTTLENTPYVFRFQWVARDSAWYMSIFDVSSKPLAQGIKVVLGTYLGARYITVPLFQDGVIVAVDLSDMQADAGYADFGTRVIVKYVTVTELLSIIGIINADANAV